MSRFAVLGAVGPGDKELARVEDLLDSLAFHEPQPSLVVLVDDEVPVRNLSTHFHPPPNGKLVSIPNPRKGRGSGWAGGLCSGILAGLQWLYQNEPNIDFVLKADTDTLVIAPFADKIRSRFKELPEVGLLGTHLHDPIGKPTRTDAWIPTLRTYLSFVSLRGRHLQVTLWGRARKIRKAMLAAIHNGYQLSECCQGGGYAINTELLRRMGSKGHLDDPLCWLISGCTEDVMMGMYCRSVGMQLSDYNRDNQVFGVRFQGLPAHPSLLLSRGYSIIHSVKDYDVYREAEVRSFFRLLRQGSEAVATNDPPKEGISGAHGTAMKARE